MPVFLALVHQTRTNLLEAFIEQSVREIRSHLLIPNATESGDDGDADPAAAAAAAAVAGGPLNASERAEVIDSSV